MKAARIISGHALQCEGAAFDPDGRRLRWASVAGKGHGRCECGAMNADLDSAAARRRWHRDHKVEVQTRSVQS